MIVAKSNFSHLHIRPQFKEEVGVDESYKSAARHRDLVGSVVTRNRRVARRMGGSKVEWEYGEYTSGRGGVIKGSVAIEVL